MKKLFLMLVMIAFMQLAGGCGLLGMGGKTYDGSEDAYRMHPEWTDNAPSYYHGEHPDDQ